MTVMIIFQSQGEVSVIAAFGPLNSRKEANAHTMTDRTMEDIRIDFSTYDDHNCTISLDDLANANGLKAWPPAKIIGKLAYQFSLLIQFNVNFAKIFFFF